MPRRLGVVAPALQESASSPERTLAIWPTTGFHGTAAAPEASHGPEDPRHVTLVRSRPVPRAVAGGRPGGRRADRRPALPAAVVAAAEQRRGVLDPRDRRDGQRAGLRGGRDRRADRQEHGRPRPRSPLPVSAAGRRGRRRDDAARRRQGVRGRTAGRQGRPRAVQRHRPPEEGPGPPRMGRRAVLPDERLPGPRRRGADRHRPLHAAAADRLRRHGVGPAAVDRQAVRRSRREDPRQGDAPRGVPAEHLQPHARRLRRALRQGGRRRLRGDERRLRPGLPPALRRPHRRGDGLGLRQRTPSDVPPRGR